MKQSHWLLFVAKKCDWSRKITPSSRFPRDENLERKQNSTAKSTNLEENGGKQRQFCHQSSPVSLKSLVVDMSIAGVEKYAPKTCGCDQHWRPFDSSLNEWSASDGGNLCPL